MIATRGCQALFCSLKIYVCLLSPFILIQIRVQWLNHMYIITLNSVFFFAQKDLIYIRYCLLLISYKMDPPSNVPFPTGSRVRITCKYCGHAMERRNLKSHTTRVHAGFTPAERPSTKQGMLSFPVSTIKRPLPGNNNGES